MLFDHNGTRIKTRKFDGTKKEFSQSQLATLTEVLESEEKIQYIPGKPFEIRQRVRLRKNGCSEVVGENRDTILNQLCS